MMLTIFVAIVCWNKHYYFLNYVINEQQKRRRPSSKHRQMTTTKTTNRSAAARARRRRSITSARKRLRSRRVTTRRATRSIRRKTRRTSTARDKELSEEKKVAILSFLNEASIDDIHCMLGTSTKRLEILLSLRPFKTFFDMVTKQIVYLLDATMKRILFYWILLNRNLFELTYLWRESNCLKKIGRAKIGVFR